MVNMFVSGFLIGWGWWFYLLSRLCFWTADTYISLVSGLILVPLGYQPLMGLKQQQVQRRQQEQAALCVLQQQQQEEESDIPHCKGINAHYVGAEQQNHDVNSSTSNLQHQINKLESSCVTLPHQQNNVERWFANTAALDKDALQSESSCQTIQEGHTQHRRLSCAAAAAASMAMYGRSADAAAATAVVGAAAILAQQYSSRVSSSSSNQQSSQRSSDCCTVPPLSYDISDEQQRELEDEAPAEFLCPLSRVLMTDPVCTPSGFTYQRSYIEDYIIKTGHDPARDLTLSVQQLYPNIVLRDQIATWLQKHGIAT